MLRQPPVIRAFGWSTVIDLESAGIVYNSLNDDAPSYLTDMFTKVNVSTNCLSEIRIMTLESFSKNDRRTEVLLLPGGETLEWFFERLKIRQL